jgi:hypothetical protein
VAGQDDNDNNGDSDAQTGPCSQGDIRCVGQNAEICNADSEWELLEECESACMDGQGCVNCVPDSLYCDEDWVMRCNENQELVQDHECPPAQTCILGECVTKCDERVLTASNVGCEFWAVDLDNEAVDTPMLNDAAAQQYAVAIANTNDFAVQVDVYLNEARVGETPQEVLVTSVNVPAMDLRRIDLPQREVDGCMGQNGTYAMYSGSGTFVSPHAYKIVSNGPVVAYQFNPVIQQFSNDASILIPIQALGKQYYVMGYPTANPCGGGIISNPSLPDRTAVTIIGIHEGTHVTVYPTHAIVASDGDSGFPIAETQAGEVLEFDIGPYDVVNLESLQFIGDQMQCINAVQGGLTGDFSGTRIEASREVSVFSSHERGLAGGEAPKPPNWDDDSCCTDHLEQQMFPITALGWQFAISRSPVRSTGSWREYDVYKVLATENNTTVETSLSEFPSFTLDAGEVQTFWAQDGFTVESQGGAIMVGQYLVSQGHTDGGNGDSTFTIFPAADQHREQYVFLILDTFEDNYMVVAMPDTAGISIDGEPQGEFPQGCEIEPIGHIDGTDYVQMTCRLDPGVHTVEGTEPVGLTVYGYYNVGSYGYPGGSDVKIINPVE